MVQEKGKKKSPKGAPLKKGLAKKAPARAVAKTLPTPRGAYTPGLKDRYQKVAVPALIKEFSYPNPMQVPKLRKVVLNVGMGKAIENSKILDSAVTELSFITGQQPVVTRAKKSISGFKLRQGMAIGCKVTLRGTRMFEFLDRLINVALPRIRDFRGVSGKAFDGRGNYSLGLKEQLLFPEIKYDDVSMTHGMDITIATTAQSDREGKALLGFLGMPFRKQ